MNEGGTNTFTVKLAAQPLSDVTVTVAHQGGRRGPERQRRRVADLYQRQLEHAADGDGRGGRGRGRGQRHGHADGVSSAGLTSVDVTANEVDNDTQGLVVSTTTLAVNEGGTNTFTVKLAAQPLSDVTVTVAHMAGDADLSVSGGASLTFTSGNWNTPQTVTIGAAEDADAVNGSATFTVSLGRSDEPDVTANEVDNDTQGLVVSTATLAVNEGGTNTFTVQLAAQPAERREGDGGARRRGTRTWRSAAGRH